MNAKPDNPREIAEAMLLFGDLLATGHTVEESATFMTAIARGDVVDAWDGEALLW